MTTATYVYAVAACCCLWRARPTHPLSPSLISLLQLFYTNTLTGESVWDRPTEPATAGDDDDDDNDDDDDDAANP